MPYTEVLTKFKHGRLRSSSGQRVTSRKQAIAIMLSEKRAAEKKREYRPRTLLG